MPELTAKVKGIVEKILWENSLWEELKGFFLDVMPTDQELTVIQARKAYSVFKVIHKAYPEEFSQFPLARVINDRSIGEWLVTNVGSPPTKIKIVDDTLFNGNTMRRCIDLLKAYGYGRDKVECYVFMLNEDLLNKRYVMAENSRREESVSFIDSVVDRAGHDVIRHTGTLHLDYGLANATPYGCPIHFSAAKPRGELRKLARQIVEVVHAASEPYIAYFPSYCVPMEDAAVLLFDSKEFPEPEQLFDFQFKPEIASMFALFVESTFEAGEMHGVYSFYGMLDVDSPYESYRMIRFYANYRLRQVMIIPYSILKPYKSVSVDLKNHEAIPSFIKAYLHTLNERLPENELRKVREENNKALLRLIRYARAYEIICKTLGIELEKYRDKGSFIARSFSIENNYWQNVERLLQNPELFTWLPDDQFIPVIEDEKTHGKLSSYQIANVYRDRKPIHKNAYDVFFNGMSDESRRTKGITNGTLAGKIVESIGQYELYSKWELSMFAYALIVLMCDRGVGVPGANAVINDNGDVTVASIVRDGELAVEAYAAIPGLFGLPWAVNRVRELCGKKWAEARDGFWKSLYELFPDARKQVIEDFRKLGEAYIGDYIIHPAEYYKYQEWISPPELKTFNMLVDDYEGVGSNC
jgi:hypothetical protein